METTIKAIAVKNRMQDSEVETFTYTINLPAPEPESIPAGLWMEEIGDQTYNGKAIKPETAVYYDGELLTAGKDYTVSYRNNTNAASADAVNAKGASIAPTVTVKGKGNFSGTGQRRSRSSPLTYKNNTKTASAEDTKAQYLYIIGKGNFADNTKDMPVKFTIVEAPLDAQTIVVDNVPYKNKNNNFVPTVTITDSTTGKKLAKKIKITSRIFKWF